MSPEAHVPVGTAAEPLPRGTWGLLTDRVFGPYFFGKLVSTAGVWVFNIVSALVVWDLTRSTVMVGAVSSALFVPQLIFAPAAGAQADRNEPKYQLVLGRLLIMGSAGGLALLLQGPLLDGRAEEAWSVIGAAAMVGIGFVVGGPAQHSVLPALVRPQELAQAVALNSLPHTISRAVGPALGVFILVTGGPIFAFALAGLANLAYAIVLALLPLAGHIDRAQGAESTVRAGLAYLRSEPAVSRLLLGMLAIGYGADPVITLTPALAADFGAGQDLVGTFASAFGLGAVMSYAAIRRLDDHWGTRRLGSVGLVCLAIGMAAAGVAPISAGSTAALFVAGAGFTWALTGVTTQIYIHVPEAMRGRMMALWSIAFLGSRPFAATINGAVADAASVPTAFVSVGIIVGLLSWLSVRRSRARDDPNPPTAHPRVDSAPDV